MAVGEWEGATNPRRMLSSASGLITDRKLRLLAVAFCRRILHLVTEKTQRDHLEIAERCADSELPLERLKDLYAHADYTSFHMGKAPVAWTAEEYALGALGDVVNPNSSDAAYDTRSRVEDALQSSTQPNSGDKTQEYAVQVVIIRDIIGDPFETHTLDPAWLTSTVVALARQMYESRDFETMPILADALEDAGCDDAEILNHCRGPGPHVRGCWVVDLILGKK